MRFDRAFYLALTSTKTWYLCGPDAVVNTSVFCADFGGKTMAARFVRGVVKQWNTRSPELYFNRTMGLGTIGLLGV